MWDTLYSYEIRFCTQYIFICTLWLNIMYTYIYSEHDHLLMNSRSWTHLQSVSLIISLTCYPLICYPLTCYLLICYPLTCYLLICCQFTCSQPQLLSGQFAIRPHLLSKRLLFSLLSMLICYPKLVTGAYKSICVEGALLCSPLAILCPPEKPLFRKNIDTFLTM